MPREALVEELVKQHLRTVDAAFPDIVPQDDREGIREHLKQSTMSTIDERLVENAMFYQGEIAKASSRIEDRQPGKGIYKVGSGD